MGSGKGKQTSTSTVTQQNIPKEFYPYFDRLLTRAEEESLQPYTPYGGQRLSETTGDTMASYDIVRDVASRGTPGLDFAANVAGANVGRAGELASSATPYDFYGYGGFSEFGFDPTQRMTAEDAQSYMDPYLRNVLDIQKRKAGEDYLTAQGGRSAAAVGAGAFGGSRQQVAESLAERDMLNRMMEIEATGQQSAYADAVRRFQDDRSARFAEQQARAAEAARVQGGQAGELARVQTSQSQELKDYLANQQALMGFASDQAGMVAKLEEAARAGDVEAARLLDVIGKAQQSQEQAGLDLAYEDFLRQQGWNKEQLGLISSILQGLPIANAGEQVQMTPYNPIQQALGAGLAAYGTFKGMS
jgi:hypothetical protein